MFVAVIFFTFWNFSAEALAFSWETLKGDYEFINCAYDTAEPVWGARLEETFIRINVDRSVPQRNNLKVYLLNKTPHPLALHLPLNLINQGVYKRYTNSGVIGYQSESFTYAAGLQSFAKWQNEKTQGWSSFNIEELEGGMFKYEMKQYRSNTREFKSETCYIKRL